MIGILFLGAIAIWAWIALALGRKIPKWLGITRYRKTLGCVLALLVFVAPVADEIIAYPQMQALCASLKPYELAPGMDEKSAYGRTVDQAGNDAMETLWPSTVRVKRINVVYVDEKTREPVLEHSWLVPMRGMLGVPDGSGDGHMTVFLNTCGPTKEAYDRNGLPTRFNHLNLIKISR